MYDLIIVGSGIGGISASIYAKRSNLNFLIIDKSSVGGLINKINVIDNYPGFSSVTGEYFCNQLKNHMNNLEINVLRENVINVDKENNIFKVSTDKNIYEAKNVIIAIGRSPRKLGLEYEDELIGHGISNCALCDGNFFRNKDIAIVGAGLSSLEEAIYLSKIVNKIYLIVRRDSFVIKSDMVDKILKTENIEVIYKSSITKLIKENNVLSGIVLNNEKEIPVSGLFVYIGYYPNSEIVKNLEISDESGYIEVNDNCQTKIAGLYAIGDIIKKDVYQLVTAASEGAIAITDINKRS